VVDRQFTGVPDWGISMSRSGESYVSVVKWRDGAFEEEYIRA
jgi:hypothetical protein